MRGRKIGVRRPGRYAAAAGLGVFMLLSFISLTGANGKQTVPDKKIAKTNKAILPENRLTVARDERACGITLDDGNPLADVLEAGDKIDIIASFPSGSAGGPETRTVVAGARVVDIGHDKRAGVIIVSITPKDAEKLAYAQANGKLVVVLCPPGPNLTTGQSGVTYDDL